MQHAGSKRKLTVREVQTTARPRATAGTITVTLSSSFPDASAQPERLVKRTRSDMEAEGPSGDRKVLPEHPLEYKKDEEESEGEAYLPHPQEERMAQWPCKYSCEYCGRMATNASFPYCSEECSNRDWDQMQQERDSHYDWYCNSFPSGSLLQGYFEF